MKRLFIGLNFTPIEKQYFSKIQQQLHPYLEKGQRNEPSNFHVTLQFIGQVSEESIVTIKEIMASTSFEPVKLVFNHVGYFQKKNRYVVYIGCEEQQQLTQLAMQLNNQLAEQNIVEKTNHYVPHLTLARNTLVDVSMLSTVSVHYECEVSEMTLYESTRINDQLVYLPIYVVNSKEG